MDTDAIERLKLTATLLNNLSAAFFVTGVIGPMVSVKVPGDATAAIILLWVVFAAGFHGLGLLVLGEIRQ